jgi:1-acyl-sn-glycerol-3-phosphate acyltransferase
MPPPTLAPQQINRFWRVVRPVTEFLVWVVFGWGVRVGGLEHVPRRGGAVLVYNHHSYFDFIMVAWDIVRRLHRPLRFLAKAELWGRWTVRPIVRGALAIPVDRAQASGRHGALDAAVAALRAGDLVVVAPEQTISRSFELLPFKSGAVRMAQAADVPIVPVVGWGTHRFLTKGHGPHLARRIPVIVRYGAPLHIAADEDPVAATQRVRGVMAAQLDEVQRSYPDRPRPGRGWWQPARLGGTAPDHASVLGEHRRRERGWEPRHG